MAITANTCRVCGERFRFDRGQGYAHDLCSIECECDELRAENEKLKAMLADHVRVGPLEERAYFERLDAALSPKEQP
jgi:hypothetical protein